MLTRKGFTPLPTLPLCLYISPFFTQLTTLSSSPLLSSLLHLPPKLDPPPLHYHHNSRPLMKLWGKNTKQRSGNTTAHNTTNTGAVSTKQHCLVTTLHQCPPML